MDIALRLFILSFVFLQITNAKKDKKDEAKLVKSDIHNIKGDDFACANDHIIAIVKRGKEETEKKQPKLYITCAQIDICNSDVVCGDANLCKYLSRIF